MAHDLSRRAFLKQGLAASNHPGWMQGALASGVRAAPEVMGARA
jgi:hypothetical protein